MDVDPRRVIQGIVTSIGFLPNEEGLRKVSLANGYEIARDSLSISYRVGQPEWRFLAVARDKRKGVESFQVTPARN